MTASIALILLSGGLIGCWYAGADARSVEHAGLPSWLRYCGLHIAALGLVAQLMLSMLLIGVVTGPLLVLVAWMTVGGVFAACVNAWPYRTIRCAGLSGLTGAMSLVFIWLSARF